MSQLVYANPLLFLLLKEICAYEIGHFYHKVTDLTACQYFETFLLGINDVKGIKSAVKVQSKSKKFPKDTSTFKRYVWNNNKDFCFTKHRLNLLAQTPRFLGKFESWEDFTKTQNKAFVSRFDKYAKYTYIDLAAEEILPIIKNEILQELAGLSRLARIRGSLKGYNYNNLDVLFSGDTIRSAEEKDKHAIGIIRKEKNIADELINVRLLNSNAILHGVFANRLDIVTGGFMLLIINEKAYLDLKSGKREIVELNNSDLVEFKFGSDIRLLLTNLVYSDSYSKKLIAENIGSAMSAFLNSHIERESLDITVKAGPFAHSPEEYEVAYYRYIGTVFAVNNECYEYLIEYSFTVEKPGNILSQDYQLRSRDKIEDILNLNK